MKKRRLSKREKLIISITLGIFIGSLAVNGVMLGRNRLISLNQEIANKSSLLRRHFLLVERGGDIRSVYESYKKILEIEGSGQELDADLFNEVKRLTEKLNLSIDRIKPLPVESKANYAQVLLEVEIGGDFKSIFEFINGLENSPSFIRVLNLRLYPQSGSSAPLRCKCLISRLFFS
ncbi:MAG: type 4a pilus biogenesis protein PilO [Candidatus Omnitrophota bacterium]|nr:type 4a pilus biogenesis protein PilO [Candidatus Omnitrophota bacterium]